MEARRACNGGKDLPIRCKVFLGLSKEDEATLFALQTGISTCLTAGERLRAKQVVATRNNEKNFCEGDELRDGAQLSPQWSRLKTTAHRKQKRNILTCQFAVENHLSLGKIDKVKKKPVPILTFRKEYGIVNKHRINFHLSA